jgi:SPP1 gp7 family putative phage head morphogenesis protein
MVVFVALNLDGIFKMFGGSNVATEANMPKQDTGKTEASFPISMTTAMGDQGVSKVSRLNAYDYEVTAKNRYLLRKRHAYIAAVHNAIVKQVKKVELRVVPIDDAKPVNEKTKKNMENFIKSGFGPDGEKEFRGRLIDTKKWYGDTFAEIVFDSGTKEPLSLNYLMAETMRALPNEHGQIVGYPQVVDGDLNFTFAPANIIHLREHPDEYSFFGFSDLDALFTALLLDIMADEYSTERLKNDASHGGIGVFDENTDEIELLRLRWLVIKQLRQAPGKPLFLNRLKQWIPTGVNPKDIDWVELHRQVKEKVMMVYSVLPMQVAVVETGKLANPEQQLEIGEEYIKQELEQVQSSYNSKLTPFFNGSENLMFQFAELEPKLDAKQKEAVLLKTKAETVAILAGISATYTKDELREITGHTPLATGGDELHSPPTPLPFGSPSPGAQGQDPTQDTQGDDNQDPNSVPNEDDPTQATKKKSVEVKPFAGYTDMADCVSKNGDKEDPGAYCATIMRATESAEASEKKSLELHKASRAENARRFKDSLEVIHAKFNREVIKAAKANFPKEKALRGKSLGAFEQTISSLILALHRDLDKSVKDHSIKSYADSKAAIGAVFNHSDEHAITAMLMTDGTLDAVKDFTLDQRAGFKQVILDAFEKGLDERKMAKEMRNYAEDETYKLARIARTESNKFANRGRFAGYKDLEQRRGEQYEYEWVGPDDDRTTEICADIKADNPYSLPDLMNVTDGGEPHINCRHNLVRVVE